MHDQKLWSLSLGRWGPVQVRLHMFFLLFAAISVYFSWRYSLEEGDSGRLCLLGLGVLVVSVVVHELAHCFVAARLGGGTDQIILGPLGGLVPVRVPFDPRSELIAIMAGPIVNLIICLVSLAVVLAVAPVEGELERVRVAHLLNPLAPPLQGASLTAAVGVQMTLWVNWLLFLVNTIPAFPFDGGRALLALLAIFPRPVSSHRAVQIVAGIAKVVAIGLLVAAWLVRDSQHPDPLDPNPPVPTWFALVLLSIFLFFSARVEESQHDSEESDEELFGYDFSQGYTSLERRDEGAVAARGPIMRWIERRREQRRRHQRAVEAEEDRRMDEILARLHETGIENLSREDRALLQRVAARYRSRERK